MHKRFKIKRFGWLFIKHTEEHLRTYLMAIIVLMGVLGLGGSFIFFVFPDPPDTGLQTACFIVLLLLSGTLFTSMIFSDYSHKSKAIAVTTLPASSLEKFLIGWLFSYPFFLTVFTAAFYTVLGTFSHTVHWSGKHFQSMAFFKPEICISIIVFTFLHSLWLFGAIYFRGLHFIKTAFAFFFALVIAIIGNTAFLKIITGQPGVKSAMPFAYLNMIIDNKFYSVAASEIITLPVLAAIFLTSLLIWTAGFFRLKEKQV